MNYPMRLIVTNLDKIFDYTAHEFGMDQSVKYISAFDDVFEQLLQNPQIGLERKEIRDSLRSIPITKWF